MPRPEQYFQGIRFSAVGKPPVAKEVDSKQLAKLIKRKARNLRLSLDYAAEFEGVSRRTLNYWLVGERLYVRSGYIYNRGIRGLKRILAWLERLEAGTEPMPVAKLAQKRGPVNQEHA